MKILKGILRMLICIWIGAASAWLALSIKLELTEPELIEHRKKVIKEIKEAWKNRNN